jgi:hypothetical protein
MKVSNWIELPADKYGNRGYTNSQAQVIRARVEPGTGKPGTVGATATLHVIEPESFKDKWPIVRERTLVDVWWWEVDHPPGPITEREYAEIVASIPDLPDWVYEAVRQGQ